MNAGAIAASGVTTITLPFVPQAIGFANITTITRLVVTVLGDGIIADYDAIALANLKNMRQQSVVPVYAEIMLANGIVKGRTCTIEVTNGATASTLYQTTYSDSGEATLYWGMFKQTVLAGAGTDFEKFGILGLGNCAVADYAIIQFEDGATQRFEQAEFRIMLAKFQAVEGNTNDNKIDNIDGWLKRVTFYPAAQQLVYIQKWIPVGVMVEGVN
jgi:hypothetical protein